MNSWDIVFLVRQFWIPLQWDFYESGTAFTVVQETLHRKYSELIPFTPLPPHTHVYMNEPQASENHGACKQIILLPLTFKATREEGRKQQVSSARVNHELTSTSFHLVLIACGSNTKCLSSHTKVERKLPLFPVRTWTLTLSLHRYLLWVWLLYEAKCLTQTGKNDYSVLPPEPCCPPHGMRFRFWQAENIQI